MKILEEKKKNLLSLLLSVLGIGVLVSLFANILFTELYTDNKIIFIVICSILFILNLYFLSYVIYRLDKVVYKVNVPIIFNNKENQFMDLPYSPTSVRARVLYSNLSTKQKDLIIKNGEIYEFANSFVVQYIFTLIFKNTSKRSKISKWISVDRKYLKDLLINYKYIDVNDMVDERGTKKSIELPKGFKIKSAVNNTIVISTKQGFIKLIWDISMCSP